MFLALNEVTGLLTQRGHTQYGMEAVSQLEHALQCAYLAEQAGETSETIVAALLHDFGHLLAAERDGLTDHDTGKDDLHQFIALPFLRKLFPSAVLEPIRLHVDAKRYLCATRPDYFAALSEDSKRSLALQGGIFSPGQADSRLRRAP